MVAAPQPDTPTVRLQIAGEWLVPLCEGALWWPDRETLVVSDLHLEKGSSFAARGQLLPPYDTCTTLDVVERLARRLRPVRIVSLGDSFHDRGAEIRLSEAASARIRALTSAHDWFWVEGNHDPHPPRHLGGRGAHVLQLGPLAFRHEPTGAPAEIAGHLHPAARVSGRGRALRRRCFATDGERLVLPALGAFTGGLNVRDPVFEHLFPDGVMALVMGERRVYPVRGRQLLPDGASATPWRLEAPVARPHRV